MNDFKVDQLEYSIDSLRDSVRDIESDLNMIKYEMYERNEQDIIKVSVTLLGSSTKPTYATIGASGMDLYSSNTEPIVINPAETKLIPTGVKIALPSGYEAQVRPRSGLALKHSITVLNTPGTIDSDYRGEIGIIVINHGSQPFEVPHKFRIAQLVVTKYTYANLIYDEKVFEKGSTERGSSGFGSTGTT